MKPTMLAAYLTEHGGPEVIQLGDLPTPTLAPDEVLVEIHAAALNHLDIWVRRGWPGIKLHYPHIQGADGAGIVRQVGSLVTTLHPGDRVVINGTISTPEAALLAGADNLAAGASVLGEHRSGTFAQYLAIPARNCLPVPPDVSFDAAAAAALVFLTAWHSLITRGQLRPGEKVLVVGAGGGVNTAAIQIAALAGCEVYVIGSNAEKLARAKSLGAHHLIDRSAEPQWSRTVYTLTNKQGADVVVDNVGAATYMHSLRALRRGGRLLTVGNTSGPTFELDNRLIFGKQLTLIGSTMGTMRDFATVMNLVFTGQLRAPIDSVYPLTEARAAQEKLERGDIFGKLILHPPH